MNKFIFSGGRFMFKNKVFLIFTLLGISFSVFSKEATYETHVTCTEKNTDYNFKEVGVALADGPMPFGLIVEVNEDDGLSRNTEKYYTKSLKVIHVDSKTTRYVDKYENFDLIVTQKSNGKLIGKFSRTFDGPGSYELSDLNCVENSQIKVLE